MKFTCIEFVIEILNEKGHSKYINIIIALVKCINIIVKKFML